MTMLLIRKPSQELSFFLESEDFRTVAITQHGNQPYGTWPYAVHLSMVETILVNHGYNSRTYRACAWLHDTLEDTAFTPEQMMEIYGETILVYVEACTGRGNNRQERNESIYTKLTETPLAAPIKVADRMANMKFSAMTGNLKKMEMYIKEFPRFSEVVRPLMTDTRLGAIFWNDLEEVAAGASRKAREIRSFGVAEAEAA